MTEEQGSSTVTHATETENDKGDEEDHSEHPPTRIPPEMSRTGITSDEPACVHTNSLGGCPDTSETGDDSPTQVRDIIRDFQERLSSIISTQCMRSEGLERQLLEKEIEETKRDSKSKGNKITELERKNKELRSKLQDQEKQSHEKDKEIQRSRDQLLKKGHELELAAVKTSTPPPQQQPNHQKCEEKMIGLTKQLSEAQGTIENLQRICRERTMEMSNLQQQVIDSNNLTIRLQQETSDQHFKTNERLTSMNAQLFEFLDANTGRWTDGTKGKEVPQNSPDPKTNLLNVTSSKAVHQNPQVQDTHRPAMPPSNPTTAKPPQNTQPKAKSPPGQNPVASMEKGQPNGMKAPTVKPKIIYFKGASHSLSNWAPCNLMYQGMKFTSVEQAYFHRLLTEHGEHQLATQILKLENASDIKTVGESVNVSDGWKKKRADILMDIMSTKFQLPTFQDELLATYPNELHHNVASNYWGIGLKRQGQNITGRILMEIREKLHKEKSKGTQMLAASYDVLLARDSQLRGFDADKITGVNFTSEGMRSA